MTDRTSAPNVSCHLGSEEGQHAHVVILMYDVLTAHMPCIQGLGGPLPDILFLFLLRLLLGSPLLLVGCLGVIGC